MKRATEVYLLEKTNPHKHSKRVLLEAGETLAWSFVEPIYQRLKTDPRCGTICLLTDSAKPEKIDGDLIPEIQGQFDIALTFVEGPESVNVPLLFGAKRNFGVEKLYFFVTSWIGDGTDGRFFKNYARMDKIDGFFCNDQLSKDIFLKQNPQFKAAETYTVGSPLFDNLNSDNALKYRREGRDRLKLSPETPALLYLGNGTPGGINPDYYVDPTIDFECFRNTLTGLIPVALSNSGEICVLVRPHPADSAEHQARLFKTAEKINLPPNLKVIPATRNEISMQEVGYAVDILAAVGGTELFLAPTRGRVSLFLAFPGRGNGKETLENFYGKGVLDILRSSTAIKIIQSNQELTENFYNWVNLSRTVLSNRPVKEENSLDRIFDIIFG